ncbi:glycoside hydrolase family 38 C-terminal domain-containing protein [Bacillus infantis]|uniref:glycoside hydrolase family 38 N-terminal domain-containing protein n=1 Tax=Bacillus infantis TaxID=324767 RepID=UPI003019BE85
MENVREVHILNHTHWDREWYETFEEFRYKLRNGLRYIQTLLEEGKIENFFLDGQTIVLDDYREVVGEEEYHRLLSFIKDGKVEAGPWYLLADEFLVSGESMIKNLEIGTKMAKAAGSSCDIGYLPDTFGHISQMPQILKQSGISTALIFRGAVSDHFENTWEGPDSSKVFTFVLPLFEGYYQTFLKHDAYVEETKAYLEGSSPYLTFGKALVMNGADHTFTAPDLQERIKGLEEQNPGIKFKQSLMSEFIESYKGEEPEGEIHGEQRDPSKIFILPGVLSTRTYLKNQNQMCEDQAIGVMEALNVWTNASSRSEHFMEYVWKLILQNQPHDSICGCSVDEVHDEMETRSKKVLGAIRQFSRDTLNGLYPFEFLDSKKENPYLYLINSTPIADIYPVRAAVRVPAQLDRGSIELYQDDAAIAFDIISREQREEFLHDILAEPHYGEYVVYEVAYEMPFDGAEIKRVKIELVEKESFTAQEVQADSIENDYYKVEWDQHGLIITDLETGTVHHDQHQFLSSLDAGDTYNYSPPVNDVESRAVLARVREITKGDTFQSAVLEYEMTLPASLNDSRTGAGADTVVNMMTTIVTLNKGRRTIDFKTTVENRARDQKLRVGFAAGRADYSYGDTAFDLIKRETIREKNFDMPKNKEAVMNQYPSYSSAMANEHQLVHRGLQEFEVDDFEGNDMIFLTMIRSVGWLSRRDLRTRGNGAGPGFETPGAQCIGTYEFEYALVLGREHHSLNHAKVMRQPVLVQQSCEEKEEQKLFKLSSNMIAFSSFMVKEEDSFDIRLFNPSDEEASTALIFGFLPTEVSEVDFTGETVTEFTAERELTLSLQPKQIKTIRIKRKAHPQGLLLHPMK